MATVTRARTARSTLIATLLRLRAIGYLAAGGMLVIAPSIDLKTRLIGASLIAVAGLAPLLAGRIVRLSSIRVSAIFDILVAFFLWLLAPPAAPIALGLTIWAVAFATLLDTRRNGRIVAGLALALQIAQVVIATTEAFPFQTMPVLDSPPNPIIPAASTIALAAAYFAFSALDAYLSALRRQAESSDAAYRSLMDTAPLPFVVVVDKSITYLNEACATLLGGTVDELLGTSLIDRVATDSLPAYRRLRKRVLRGLSAVDRVTVELLAADGNARSVEMSANPVDHGDRVALQIMMYDRTAQHAAEAELEKTRMDYRTFFERIPVALYRSRPDGEIVHVNQAAVELLGATDPAQIIGTNAMDYYRDQSDRDRLNMILSDDGIVVGYEWEMRRLDGEIRWVRDTSRLISTGKARYFEGAMVDVTTRRTVEQELWSRAIQQEAAASVGQLALETEDVITVCETLADVVREVLAASAVVIVRRTADGGFETIGTDVSLPPESLSGLADRSHMSAAPVIVGTADEMRTAAPAVLAAGYRSCAGVMVPGKALDFASLVVLHTTEQRFSGDDINFLQSVTNVLAAAVDRANAYERLEALVASKDAFVASVSHELRTPLTVVSGLAHELSMRWKALSEEEMDEFIDMMVGQSLDMADLIEDLLVAARSHIGTVAVQVQELDVEKEVGRVISGLERHAQSTISCTVEPGTIEADGVRFRQILRNLVNNAIKYGGEDVAIVGTDNGGVYAIEVRDSGDPIPVADRERIFEPYERAHDSTGQPGSVGLGLAVSRTLAELMRGSLVYHHDGDSVFRLELPAEGASDVAPGVEPNEEIIGMFGAVGSSRIGVDVGSIK